MNNENKKVSLAVMLGLGIMVFLIFTLPQPKPTKTIQMTSVIDSAWSKSPGEENTLQLETIYFGKTKDSIVHRRKRVPFIKGEKVEYIFKQTK
jgi:hypothetical protein